MPQIVLVIHDVRSLYNVGSLLRSADGFGVEKVYMSGHTPYPKADGDKRLPHVAARAEREIHKTALGAEKSVVWEYCDDLPVLLKRLSSDGYKITALEQTPGSVALNTYSSPTKIVLIVGAEVDGIESEVLKMCDTALVIPMRGEKESFNVASAAAVALYQLALCNFHSNRRHKRF